MIPTANQNIEKFVETEVMEYYKLRNIFVNFQLQILFSSARLYYLLIRCFFIQMFSQMSHKDSSGKNHSTTAVCNK